MTRPARQTGFALMMALVLIVLAAVVLAGVARRSMEGALRARQATAELQRRWAMTSCRATLLDRAEKVFAAVEAERIGSPGDPASIAQPRPLQPQVRVRCELAGRDYELVFTDEQAKLNVNSLLADGGRGRAQTILRELLGETADTFSRRDTPLMLRALAGDERSGGARRDRVGGYGQIFQHALPEQLIGHDEESGLAADVTCWSDGKVNVRRAAPRVIRLAVGNAVTPDTLAQLFIARRDDPHADLDTLLQRLADADDQDKAELRKRLTGRSACHGLWVIARGEQRWWYEFVVARHGRDPTRQNRYDFTW